MTQMRDMSNLWQTASQKLQEQQAVNRKLERDLAALAKSNAALAAAARSSAGAVAREGDTHTPGAQAALSDSRLQQLEGERDELSGKIDGLTKSLGDLQVKMTETQRRLDLSEGDREQLLHEMKRLQAQKSKLEEQFYSLACLREQLQRMRTEQTVSRRLERIRRGLYGQFKIHAPGRKDDREE